ncbi:hypothetical protein [Intestinibacter sp.]|uniref:hypothetical protein n=1 Tax=Intestinibacter sp. TaxID=1965304 RepID=UPI002A74739D|nr:hypothetical protein [Intestinibacter sp.]MDY2737385.1 hypothetical protein [Intestinibacter sp.]
MKKLLSIILFLILGLNIVGCSDHSVKTIVDKSSSQQEDIEEEQQEEKEVSFKLSNGTFKVGEDLDPGKYVLVKHDGEYMGSFDITTDTTGDTEAMVDSNAFENFTYIEVKDGQYLQLDDCDLYKIEEIEAEALDFSDFDELTNGMYIVGKDIEAGEHKLEAISEDSDGWYCLYNNLGDGYKNGPDLQDADYFSGSKLITLREGQYLKLDSNTKVIK